jgi:2'-5' RNA ligase
MDSCASEAGQEYVYALVSYIEGPLGQFLDDLRRELVPGYEPRAHITLMPPRYLCGPPEGAWQQIEALAERLSPFTVEATEIRKFPGSNVIYIDVGAGRQTLIDIHRNLNIGCMAYTEQFQFHPHITLVQNVPIDSVPQLADVASAAWAAFKHSRIVHVTELTFVKSLEMNRWSDVARVNLDTQPVAVRKR